MQNGKKERALKKFLETVDPEEQKLWESGNYYGENPIKMTGEQLKDWNEFKAKIHPTSLRLPPELLEELRKYAKEEGLGLHSLIKMLLTRAVRDRKSA